MPPMEATMGINTASATTFSIVPWNMLIVDAAMKAVMRFMPSQTALRGAALRRILAKPLSQRNRRDAWHRLSAWLGFRSAHVLVLGFLLNLTVALATLRALGML